MAAVEYSFEGDTRPIERALDKVKRKVKDVEKTKPEAPFDKANKSAKGLANSLGGLQNTFASIVSHQTGVNGLTQGFGKLGMAAAGVGAVVSLVLANLRQAAQIKFEVAKGNLEAMGKSAANLQEGLSFDSQLAAAKRGWSSVATQIGDTNEKLKYAQDSADDALETMQRLSAKANVPLFNDKGLPDFGRWKDAVLGITEQEKELAKQAVTNYQTQQATVLALTRQKALLEATEEAAKEKNAAEITALELQLQLQEQQAELERRKTAENDKQATKAAMEARANQTALKARIAEYAAEKQRAGQATKTLATMKSQNQQAEQAAKWAEKVANAGANKGTVGSWIQQSRNRPQKVQMQSTDRANANQRVVETASNIASKGEDAVTAWLDRFQRKSDRGIKASERDREVAKLLREPERPTGEGSVRQAEDAVRGTQDTILQNMLTNGQSQLSVLQAIANSFEGGMK